MVGLIATIGFAGSKCSDSAMADSPECPHDRDSLLSVPGRLTNVPEYHDCQRFLVMDGGTLKYGDLEAVYVRYKFDSVYNAPVIVPIPLPGPDVKVKPLDPTASGVWSEGGTMPKHIQIVGQVQSGETTVHSESLPGTTACSSAGTRPRTPARSERGWSRSGSMRSDATPCLPT